jgi:hypothetical protein
VATSGTVAVVVATFVINSGLPRRVPTSDRRRRQLPVVVARRFQ